LLVVFSAEEQRYYDSGASDADLGIPPRMCTRCGILQTKRRHLSAENCIDAPRVVVSVGVVRSALGVRAFRRKPRAKARSKG
jgi:hypothetical protein